MNNHGLVFGKFFPYHKGHEYLVRTAIENSEHTTIVVCSLFSEFIPGELRHSWVNQSVKEMLQEEKFKDKTVDVLHLDKTVPQEPRDHPDFWSIWTQLLNSLNKTKIPYDCLFTSEDYGFIMADLLGCFHHLVDKKRLKHPISGTQCRDEITSWNFDNPEFTDFIREYGRIEYDNEVQYHRRIVVVGAESCGKSTMVKNLADNLNAMYIEEYGREYTDKFNIDGIEDFYVLLQKQLYSFMYTEKDPNKSSILISDTDAIVTKVFADLYYPLRNKEFDIQADRHISKYSDIADLYILLEPTVEWVDDGTREFKKYREFSNKRIKQELDRWGFRYVVISDTDYDKRTEKALNAINNFVTEPPFPINYLEEGI